VDARGTVTKLKNLNLSTEKAGSAVDYEPLVRAAAGGDPKAIEQLLMRAQEVAFRFSLLVCGHAEDAEDVMQDALLKTYRYVGRIRKPEAFRAWLFRTVRNACLIKRRRRVDEPARVLSLEEGDGSGKRGEPHERIDAADRRKGPDELAINAWLGRRLRKALTTLGPGDRMIVLMREMEGLSTREVASITGMSEANVKTRLHRARVLLRQSLEAT
jgi:RNA polymerase sigma-70 factor (ECF subfamily)